MGPKNGRYFARAKVGGKLIRQSLKTSTDSETAYNKTVGTFLLGFKVVVNADVRFGIPAAEVAGSPRTPPRSRS